MEQKRKLSLVDRFLADTPPFWKLLGLIGLVLIGVADLLYNLDIDTNAVIIIGSVGATLSAISGFAVKDIEIIKAAPDRAAALQELFPELIRQGEAIVKTMRPVTDMLNNDAMPVAPAGEKSPREEIVVPVDPPVIKH